MQAASMKSDAETNSAMAKGRGLRDLDRGIRGPGVLSGCLFKGGLYLRVWSITHSGQIIPRSLLDPYGERDLLKIRWCLGRCALYRRRNRRRLPSGLGRIHLHVQDGIGRDG